MQRLSFILIVVIFLLTGCLRQTTASVAASKPLLPTYQEKLISTIKFFEFANEGKTFLLAGRYSFLHIYDTATFKKRVTIREIDGKDEFSVLGAGYIDDNTWYVATQRNYPNPDYKERSSEQNNYVYRYLTKSFVSIREIEPAREIHQYALRGGRTSSLAFLNKNHIGYSGSLINWHNGESYKVEMAHFVGFDYQLTSDSQVITKPYRGEFYLFNNPVTQESSIWDFSSSWSRSNLMLSRDANYALFRTAAGGCELWQVPQKKRLGRCGRSKLWGGKASRAVFRRDSQAFAVSAENKITLYSIEPFKSLMTLTLAKPVDMLAFTEDYLAAVDEAGMLRVWNIHNNNLLGEYDLSKYHNGIRALMSARNLMDFQPGGSKLVVSVVEQLLVFDLAASLTNSNESAVQ